MNVYSSISSVGDASRVGSNSGQDACLLMCEKQKSCSQAAPTRDASPTELVDSE